MKCLCPCAFSRPILSLAALTLVSGLAWAQEAPRDCLSRVYLRMGTAPTDPQFDKLFDQVSDGNISFSCYLSITASKARDAIESFRYSMLYHDKLRFDRSVKIPLTVIVDEPQGDRETRIMINSYTEWAALQKTRMTDNQLNMIRCTWLGSVSLVGGQSFNPGFIIGDGLVFFSASSRSDVKVTSIHLMSITQDMLVAACVHRL